MIRATADERARAMPGDDRIPEAIDTLTHGVTIGAPRAMCGRGWRRWSGQPGGWCSYDWLDNGRQPSATRILPELQHPPVGTIFPALPGISDGFTLLAIEQERVLALGWLRPDGSVDVTWTFVLDEVASGVTRLLVRVRGGAGYRFHGLPLPLTKIAIRIVHFIMQRKQLLRIKGRAESAPASPVVPRDRPQGDRHVASMGQRIQHDVRRSMLFSAISRSCVLERVIHSRRTTWAWGVARL